MPAAGSPLPASGIDPAALMRIRSLELRVRAVMQGILHGLHRSPRHGFSVEFTEYRPYVPGDDPRFLDWRLVARTDRYYVKRYEDETNLRAYLLVDVSPSMQYGSLPYTKADYARTLAGTFGTFLDQQGDAVGLLAFDAAVRDYLPARHRPGHLRGLLHRLEREYAGASTDPVAALRRTADLLCRRALVLLVSDFLAPLDELPAALRLLRAGGHEVLVCAVADPAEVEFNLPDSLRLRDLETGRELEVDPRQARSGYLRQRAQHFAQLRSACEQTGATLFQARTDEALDTVLLRILRR